ncbi:MAG TPA: AAA family ATPase [Candidatus Binataceae bacterium]|nr:AAA family ATPase [Candidatus Binataceae bacterium]
MRDVIVPISNVRRLVNATRTSLHTSRGTPRVIMVTGDVGLGKTTSTQHVCLTEEAIWVEAQPDWTARWMTADLAEELGATRGKITEQNHRAIIGALRERPRAVFIDEADRLVKRMHLCETLRAIHDQSGAPLVLIGMKDLPRAVRQVPQLESRIAHWVEFLPCDLRDTRMMAEQLCEIELGDDLVREIHRATAGSARKIRIGLERLERLARLRTKRSLGLSDLPDDFALTYEVRSRAQGKQAREEVAELKNAAAA